MRLILQYYYGFLQKKTERLEVDPSDNTDRLIALIAQKVGRAATELSIKCKRDQFTLRIVGGWPLAFYELQPNQHIMVEIRESEAEQSQKETKRLNMKYLQRLGFQQQQMPQKLSAVSETSEQSDEDSTHASSAIQVQAADVEDQVFQLVRSGNLEQLKHINVELLNSATFGGWNPIHFAVFLEYRHIVEYLIIAQVDLNKVTDEGWTPLMIAIHKHSIETIRLLLGQPTVDVNIVTDKGLAINLACKTNQLQAIQLLAMRNADTELKDKSDRKAADYASNEVQQLLQKLRKSTELQSELQAIESKFVPPRPPITRGLMYKTGAMLVTLNERYFVLNPDEGSFIRYRCQADYPMKPLEIIPLRSVKSVSMVPRTMLQKSGFHYFELFYSSRILLACRYEHVAQQWAGLIYSAAVYCIHMEDQLKAGEIDPDTIEKNIELEIEDCPPLNPKKNQSPEASIALPKDEVIQMRQSAPVQCEQPKSEIEQLVQDCRVNFESFEVIKELGAGAFGKVFLAKKKDDGKVFAMKALKKRTLIVKKQLRYAVTEANVLKACQHPFILGLHYAFQTPNYLYLVLDYCNGGDLSYHIAQRGTFSEAETRFYIAELVLAVEYIHNRDVIYRDMKPENILIQQNGHIKLADFGLSKEGVGDADKAKSFCGSPAYLSPDMLNQKGAGKASDIYGIGCVMFEMLNGEPPFYDDDIPTMYKNIQHGQLKFLNKKLSPEAKNLLYRMLEKDSNKRIGNKNKDEIKSDPFFKGTDWDKVLKCEYSPPITDFSGLQDEDEYEDEAGYRGRGVFQDQDYDEENVKVNRVIKFSFAK